VHDDGGRQLWTTPMWRRQTAWGGDSVVRRGKRRRRVGWRGNRGRPRLPWTATDDGGGRARAREQAAAVVGGLVGGGPRRARGRVGGDRRRLSAAWSGRGARAARRRTWATTDISNRERARWRLFRITPVGQGTRPSSGRRELLNRRRLGFWPTGVT
jgi:hypothetical protein